MRATGLRYASGLIGGHYFCDQIAVLRGDIALVEQAAFGGRLPLRTISVSSDSKLAASERLSPVK
jgi:hypothetical protein